MDGVSSLSEVLLQKSVDSNSYQPSPLNY